MTDKQGSKGPPFWGRSPVLMDFLRGLRFRDRRDCSTKRDLCPERPAKELPRTHCIMFPTLEYASTCRFCETYVSEYVLVVSET
jgi:hypothetical protein